jgi:hypothetical protein
MKYVNINMMQHNKNSNFDFKTIIFFTKDGANRCLLITPFFKLVWKKNILVGSANWKLLNVVTFVKIQRENINRIIPYVITFVKS